MASTLDRLAFDAGRLLKVVGAVTGAQGGPRKLLSSLGWDLPPGVADIGLAAVDFSSLAQSLDRLEQALDAGASSEVEAERFAELLVELEQAFTHLRAVVASLSATSDYLDKTQIKAQFLPRLSDLLTASRIGAASPVGLLFLQLFGIVTLRPFAADPTIYQVEHVRTTVDWGALSTLFTDPVQLLRSRYGWGTTAFDGDSMVANLSALLEAIGEPVRVRPLPRRVEEQLTGRFVPVADTAPALQLITSLARGDADSGLDAGMSFFPLRPSAPGATDAGVALSPFVHGFTQLQFPLSSRTTLVFESTAGLDSGVVLQFRAGAPVSLKSGLLGSGGVVESATGKAVVHVKYAAPAGSPQTLLELPGGGFIQFDLLTFTGGIELLAGTLSPSFGLEMTGGHAALRTDGADSFLTDLLPGDGIDLHFDLGMRWSAANGFHFTGSASSEVDVPLHLSIGGLEIDRLHVGVRPSESALAFEVSVAAAAKVGPIGVALDRVGALASFAFHDGNLGPLDAGLGFQPPAGIGVSVEAQGVVTGGGFLFHDPAQGLYAGVLQLSFQDQLTLTAYGLIATKMPDGSRGYSLLIFITAEGFKPIPLGFGFLLQSIGGIVAVNRTFNQDVLRAGLQSDTLATLLFPRDPVTNAPALIQALAAAFPAQQGSYLLGLVARITWFTPTLVQLDLALILEFGARRRLLALARVSALLPSRDNDLIRLNMDALGVLDFDAGTLAIDAVLLDSRLAHTFPITGSAALRASWPANGGAADAGTSFVLAVGGLNPRFTPPAGFPQLQRVAIALCSGSNPRLICDSYFAVTSNTVQFGANASLYAEALGFSVSGDLGFDALVTLLPPHFLIDFHASVQLKRGSHNLFKVTLDGTLEGPLPLRIAARAKFEILWFSFLVHFDFTLADGDVADTVPAVSLVDELTKALADPASWSTRRAPTLAHGVALRSLPAGAAAVLDPLGQLVVQQQVVPLNTGRDVDTYGGQPVAGPRRFHLSASLNGESSTPLPAAFAPARYFVMSDDDKLAAPSFETMDAGLMLGDAVVTFDAATIVPAPLQYESIVLNPPSTANAGAPAAAAPATALYTMPLAVLATQRTSGAAARAPVRSVGRARFRNADLAPAATLSAPSWRIVQISDGAHAATDPSITTWTDYRAALAGLNRGGAQWQMAPTYELAAL